MFDLKYLCFMSVCETNSFSNTASELMISQQAVSRYIQKLEEELGFKLLIRDQNMVSPTVGGLHLLSFLHDYNDRLQDISLKNRSDVKTIRIGVSDWIGNNQWISAAAHKFYECYPEWQLIFCEIDINKALEMIQNRLIDCYLTTNYSLKRIRIACNTQYLFSSRLCVATSKNVDPKAVHLATSAGEKDDTCIKAREIHIFQKLGLPLQKIVLLPNHSSVLWNTSMGNGQCFVPDSSSIISNPHFTVAPLECSVDIVLGIFTDQNLDMISIFSSILKEFKL